MPEADQGVQVGFVVGDDLERARALEQLPIESLWTGGHVASRNPTIEVMMSLARLSAATSRVRIGSSVLVPALYSPAVIAKQIADLDRATEGRLVLGIGVGGEYPQEFRACRVPIEERGPRTDEAIGVLRELWTAREISHDGRFYGMRDVKIHPAPMQPGGPPIVVAGRKPVAMRRAALLGDGWMPYLYSPRRYADSLDYIGTVAADAGRDLTGFGRYLFVFTNVGPDGDLAREQAAATMGGNYNQDFRAMLDSVAAAGTRDEVRRKLEAFVDAGVRHFIFLPAAGGSDPDAIVHRLLDDIVPGLREYAGR